MIFDYKAYSRLLNEFIIEGEKIEQYRGPAFNKILEPICKFLRISRISSAVFDSTCDSAIIKTLRTYIMTTGMLIVHGF